MPVTFRATALIAAAFALMALDPAMAQGTGGLSAETMLQNIVNIFTGTVGRIIAVIAVIVTGVSMMYGALDRNAGGRIVLGIMLVFGGAWFIDQIIT